MNRHRLALLAGVVLAASSQSTIARAWDSVVDNSNHNLPKVRLVTAARPENNPGVRYILGVAKDRTGSATNASDDDVGISNLYSCNPGFDDAPNFTTSTCGFATNSDLSRAKWGWLNVRLAANREHDSEHFLIASEAARRAGLLNSSTIFKPFFVRYPTSNVRLVSQVNLNPDGGLLRALRDARLIVGQSFRPTEPGVSEAHAVREVSLLELAQLPDFSNSVADWAAGNELCPFTGIEGDFNQTYPALENCHRFEAVMGAVNVTHFAPLNRRMWAYYHNLAMTRMQECPNLANLSPLYSNQLQDQYSRAVSIASSNDTEAHECEREAMIYEMFAQHFMQDAWATGHMWKRWGQTQIDRFPDDFTLNNELGPAFGEDEVAPRQTAIALVVAALSGEVHGAKGVIVDQLREYFGQEVLPFMAPWITDDPLNGPTYPSDTFGPALNLLLGNNSLTTSKIKWLSADKSLHTGAGDLFWDPEIAKQGAVSYNDDWAFQRDTMLNCTAASMLQTYSTGLGQNGTRVSGRVDSASQDARVAGVDPASDDCWAQWATNASMRAALGRDPSYVDLSAGNTGLDILGGAETWLINNVLFRDRTSLVGFVPVDPTQPATPAQIALEKSRDKFLDRMKARMQDDLINVRASYATNMEDNANGSESAHGVDSNGNLITLINTLPFADPAKDAKLSDLVPYIDKLVPQIDIDAFDASSELDSAVSRVFWRGNIVRTCQESVEASSASLLDLRARCIAAAASGGNADVCSDCVNMAEPLIPDCGAQQSKCSAALNQSTPVASPGLPTWWFDIQGRQHDQLGDLPLPDKYAGEGCLPPYYVALDWCTQTKSGHSDLVWVNPPTEVPCGVNAPVPYGTFRERVGSLLAEPSYNTNTWVPQVVIARTDETTTVPGDGSCGAPPKSTTHGYDKYINSLLTNQEPPSERVDNPLGTPQYPRCGGIQVYEGWDRPCSIAQSGLAAAPQPAGYYNSVTGEETAEATYPAGTGDPKQTITVCALYRPRLFVAACPENLQCNAGGECVPQTQCDADGGACVPRPLAYTVIGAQKPPAPSP
jgi:hypothetical protein